MSDPLTALMHAVQVMNLLKTLITKTLREREENATTTGGYSPMSSCSSDRQTDGDFDSHQEMDTSCELRRTPFDCDEQANYSNTSEDDEQGIESLSEIEERFLKQLYKNENAKNSFRKELLGDSNIENVNVNVNVSPVSVSNFNIESGTSLCDDSRTENSGCTSYEADSGVTSISVEHKVDMKNASKACGSTDDTETVDKLVDSGFCMANETG